MVSHPTKWRIGALAHAARWVMRAVAGVVVLAALATATGATPLPRVAAVGLCSDHYVLLLAAPEQIASLSFQATGPLSPNRDLAAGFPTNRASAEEMLFLDVDVVVMDAFRTAALSRMLERRGIPIVRVNSVATLDGVLETLLEVGQAIGREERAQGVAAALEARLAAVSALEPTPLLAAYFRPDGGSAGPDTFVGEAMLHAGLRNLMAELGINGWGRLSLEALILSPPDLFILSFFDTHWRSIVHRFANHPVFNRFLAQTPLVVVPGEYWPCAGPHLVDAIDHLASESRALGLELR